MNQPRQLVLQFQALRISLLIVLGVAFGYGQTIQRAAFEDKGGQVYNVKAYGVMGNGVTDDAVAIQVAINTARSAGGVVFFPAGTYIIGTGLTLPPGVALVGASSLSSVLKMKDGRNIDMIKRQALHGQYSYIKDLYLDGNRSHNASGLAIYWVGGAVSSYFENINIVNFAGKGMVLDGCDEMLLTNIYINNCGDTGLEVADCTQMQFINVASERSGSGSSKPAVLVKRGNSNSFTDLGIEQNGGGTSPSSPNSIGLHLDSTIGTDIDCFFALGSDSSNCVAILIDNASTPGRSSRYTLRNITQTNYTRLVGDSVASPNFFSTAAGITHYCDYETISGNLMIRGLDYDWPTANSPGFLLNNGAGVLKWQKYFDGLDSLSGVGKWGTLTPYSPPLYLVDSLNLRRQEVKKRAWTDASGNTITVLVTN